MSIKTNNLNIPSSLNTQFFTKALRNVVDNNNFEIKEISLTMGSGAGENYCSDIYRAKILIKVSNGNIKRISLIIKSIPKSEIVPALKQLNVYSKEKIMYFDVLPIIYEILQGVKVSPRCYYTEYEPINTFVFEDLSALGYKIKSRQFGLDEVHGKLVMDKLGKYHAATMVFNKNNPEILKNFRNGYLNSSVNTNDTTKFLEDSLSYAVKIMLKWSGFESMGEKLQKIDQNFVKTMAHLFDNKRGDINVLTHGDLWINNIMFKYDAGGQPNDAVFIDFPISSYHSPAIDLNYFFYTSLQLNVIKEKIEQLLKIYYDSLKAKLLELKVDSIPTIEQIKEELKCQAYYGIFTVIGFMPILIMDHEDSTDNSIETFANKEIADKKRDIIFKSERIVQTMQYALKYFDEIGALDELVNLDIN